MALNNLKISSIINGIEPINLEINKTPIKINKNVELRKARIKNKTELTGFFEKITDRLLKIRKIDKNQYTNL